MTRVLLAAAAIAVTPTVPAQAHFYAGCQKNPCKRHVVKPYRGWLKSVRVCESGGRWNTNTGNGFFGAYQFTLQSWYGVGGYGYPHTATPVEQSYRAVRLLFTQGRGAWPVCG